jgi:hypothetical protein
MSGRKGTKSVSGKDKEGDGKRQGQIGMGGGGGGGASSRVSVLVFPKLQDPKDAAGSRLLLLGKFWLDCAECDRDKKYEATILR